MASAMSARTFVAVPATASSFAGRRVSTPRAATVTAPRSALQTTSRAAGACVRILRPTMRCSSVVRRVCVDRSSELWTLLPLFCVWCRCAARGCAYWLTVDTRRVGSWFRGSCPPGWLSSR
eukprot:scaffold1146_cov399-Prasinococcus_capsulatus_cf.AAC.16